MRQIAQGLVEVRTMDDPVWSIKRTAEVRDESGKTHSFSILPSPKRYAFWLDYFIFEEGCQTPLVKQATRV